MKARTLVARNIRRLRIDRELSQEMLAVDADIVGIGISFGAGLGHDLPINGDSTRCDQLFGSAPRGDTGGGEKLL